MTPAVTGTLEMTVDWKPLPVTDTVYAPKGRSWNMYSPALDVTVLWETPVAASTASTVAPGTTAPEGSVTEPLMPPRNVWARLAIGAASRSANTSSTTVDTLRVMRLNIAPNLLKVQVKLWFSFAQKV